MRAWCVGAALCVGVMAASPTAWGDDAGADAVTAHFDKGVQLFERDDFVGALEEFQAADRAHHQATITYNIARARESLGQAQGAYDAYEAYVGEAGAQAEYLDAATVALARIKARATSLRIDTDPPGATVRVDGIPLKDRSPASVLVFKGRHRVEVDWDDAMDARDVQVDGDGAATTQSFRKKEPPKPGAVAAPSGKSKPRTPAGLVAGVGFSINYTALVVKEAPSAAAQANPNTPTYRNSSLMFGATLEAGYPFTPRSALMMRFHCGLGSTEKALFSLGSMSLGYNWRASPRWWVGGGAIVGSSDKNIGATYNPLVGARSDDKIEFVSDVAIGPTLEAGVVLGEGPDGAWVLSVYPSLLLGTAQGQSTLYVPLVAGYRWY